jgi:ABC-type bacteriocin/lantibiotic exporter with double-glycine peptidase domain
LKNSGLDKDIFKNYRPVSNLPLISKVLEKVIFIQLDEHLNRNVLRDPLLPAYRQMYSTATALLRVHQVNMIALDVHSSVALVLLDLPVAVVVIDLLIMFQRFDKTWNSWRVVRINTILFY